jgi:hypothetical protein
MPACQSQAYTSVGMMGSMAIPVVEFSREVLVKYILVFETWVKKFKKYKSWDLQSLALY